MSSRRWTERFHDELRQHTYPGQLSIGDVEWPFPCCDHCGCGTEGGVWPDRTGHDDTCRHGCNDPDTAAEMVAHVGLERFLFLVEWCLGARLGPVVV